MMRFVERVSDEERESLRRAVLHTHEPQLAVS
jgi:hypothetical protein